MIIFVPLTLSKENAEGQGENYGRGSLEIWKIPADTMEDSRTEAASKKR